MLSSDVLTSNKKKPNIGRMGGRCKREGIYVYV